MKSIQSKAPYKQSKETIKPMCLCVSKKINVNPLNPLNPCSKTSALANKMKPETLNLKPETQNE
jgi:hypothetical protein